MAMYFSTHQGCYTPVHHPTKHTPLMDIPSPSDLKSKCADNKWTPGCKRAVKKMFGMIQNITPDQVTCLVNNIIAEKYLPNDLNSISETEREQLIEYCIKKYPSDGSMSPWVIVGIVVGVLLLFVILFFIFRRMRKGK